MSACQSPGITSRWRDAMMLSAALALGATGVAAHAQVVNAGQDSATSMASQDAVAGSVHALGLRVGHHGQYKTLSAFWQTPTWWSKTFENGWGRVDLFGEASVTYWDARQGKADSMWQAGFAPFLRWWPSHKPFYIEAGFGPTAVSETRFAGYGLSTALQFGSHIGVGYVFNKKHQISLRASHFSNASIKQPNDGLNLVQLDYSYHF